MRKKDTLYRVNRFNKGGFMPKENLFAPVLYGSSVIERVPQGTVSGSGMAGFLSSQLSNSAANTAPSTDNPNILYHGYLGAGNYGSTSLSGTSASGIVSPTANPLTSGYHITPNSYIEEGSQAGVASPFVAKEPAKEETSSSSSPFGSLKSTVEPAATRLGIDLAKKYVFKTAGETAAKSAAQQGVQSGTEAASSAVAPTTSIINTTTPSFLSSTTPSLVASTSSLLSTPTLAAPTVTPYINMGTASGRAAALGQTKYLANNFGTANVARSNQLLADSMKGVSGAAKGASKFSSALGANNLSSLKSAGIGIAGSLVGQAGKHFISDGYSTGVGNAIADIGGLAGGVVGYFNPIIGAIVSAGTGIIGGAVNRAFSTRTDQAALANNAAANSYYGNYQGGATSLDDIPALTAMTYKQPYKSGWFKSADGDNAQAWREYLQNKSFAERGVENDIFNIMRNRRNNQYANSSAEGGPIETMPLFNGNNNMGAIEYGFMSDYLDTKQKNAGNKNQMTNMFMGSPSTMFDLGGDIQMNGGDFSTGLTHIDAGGSHELNPNDGVQMGVDHEGTPNLVEEGETVFNDYVFSNRILADDATKKLFHLPKKKDITFADISKKLEKEISERPNDPISEAGFKAQMQTLEEQQERQKQEMEAERAKAAFEALSPEEQTALMQQRAQQEQMAQEAAMQQEAMAQQQAQPSPEEQTMMQQQMMQADGSQAALGAEPQQFAEGGKKSTKKNAGTWKSGNSSTNWAAYTKNGLRDYLLMINDELAEADTEEKKKEIREKAIKTVNNIQKAYSEAYQANLTPSEKSEKVEALQKAFQDAGGNAYFSNISNNINMPKGHNTADTEEKGWVDGYWGPRTSIRNWGSTEYGDADYYQDLADLAAEAGLTYAPGEYKYGDNTLYQLGMASAPVVANAEGEPELVVDFGDSTPQTEVLTTSSPQTPPAEVDNKGVAPKRKADWMRYAGLFGPAVGLGMQMAGVGKPNYSDLNAAVDSAGDVSLASYKPLGDYLKFRPMDIWFEQNRMDANARATDRAIMNNASPIGTKMAGLLASGYNNQIADGELYRKALEYNDALRERVAQFNRGTNQFNADAYNQTSRFNASARNEAAGRNVNARLHAAQTKLENDAGWYNSLYGNVNGLFKGLSDLGRENAQHNMIAQMWADGLAGTATPDTYTASDYLEWQKQKGKKCKGGKMKRRGLTF